MMIEIDNVSSKGLLTVGSLVKALQRLDPELRLVQGHIDSQEKRIEMLGVTAKGEYVTVREGVDG